MCDFQNQQREATYGRVQTRDLMITRLKGLPLCYNRCLLIKLLNQVDSLNGSVMLMMRSLEAAPLLKSLPSTVLSVQTEVAELASKLTDLESQLTTSESEVRGAIDTIKKSIDAVQITKVSQSGDNVKNR